MKRFNSRTNENIEGLSALCEEGRVIAFRGVSDWTPGRTFCKIRGGLLRSSEKCDYAASLLRNSAEAHRRTHSHGHQDAAAAQSEPFPPWAQVLRFLLHIKSLLAGALSSSVSVVGDFVVIVVAKLVLRQADQPTGFSLSRSRCRCVRSATCSSLRAPRPQVGTVTLASWSASLTAWGIPRFCTPGRTA
jgi:hypothetical protein